MEKWKNGCYCVATMKNHFRKVKSLPQLYRWELSVQRGGILREKLLYIFEYVLKHFKEANDDRRIIYDLDLRRWALEAKEQIHLPSFRAGPTWILNSKRKYGIVSRKITKFINRSTMRDKEQITSCIPGIYKHCKILYKSLRNREYI